ncbi:CocE/NonD family hydrolase [Sphingomonas naphthae]|uniref:CocE/NonD family hydrolase n=1 Tax=Sphingomonas naphthae TaxID=1813468 RepID=A0ABY7TGR5_9SPHN|nr:CocE/NonD family hydrolase [Sphingomonas naphthae]WCT72422.1 CocE/NonD family hydrolase [Sphingomonas naphthae]
MAYRPFLALTLAAAGLSTALALIPPAVAADAAPAPLPASFGHYQPAEPYDGISTHTFYLPMRDGVKLAVRVERPMKAGKVVEEKLPVVWHHTLSVSQEDRDGTGERVSTFRQVSKLVPYGYVVVQVARRGNGQSLGERRGYHDRNEAQDAYDITQWLAAQPWSDGKVGIYGCSNTGDAAMHALTMRPPALKAAFAGCFSWQKYDAFRRGGIFAQWGTGPTRTIADDLAIPPVETDPDKVLLKQAAEEHQRSTPLFELWKSLPFRDSFAPLVASRFWAEGSAGNYADQIRRSGVALYIMGGWFDELRDQGLITHLNVPGSRVIIGPWKHCNNDGFALLEEMHRFFDQHLKGIDTGIVREPAIHYYTVNADPKTAWRATDTWPLAATRPQTLALSGTMLGGKSTAKPRSFPARYDAKCPEAGSGSTVQPCHFAGSGASFTGAALKADTEVTGNAIANLWVASSGKDANVFAYLEDVAPDGTVTVVTEGRLRASLRKTATAPWKMPAGVPWHPSNGEDAMPLTPGEPVALSFDMLPTSWLFKAGHRIQITVTGSDHRERARDIDPAPAITLYGDEAHPSAVTLPVIPAGA